MGVSVLIKGLGKVNFPDGMTDDAIAQSVRNGMRNGDLEVAAGLPMDAESRAARAELWGGEESWYSGSTHDFTEFDASLGNSEADWGKGAYASNSIEDVNANYAGEGPDLTGRIGRQAEINADNMNYDESYLDEVLERAIDDPQAMRDIAQDFGEESIDADYLRDMRENETDSLIDALADYAAREDLVGGNKGVVYPLKIDSSNHAVLDGNNSTRLEGTDYKQQAIDEGEIKRADFDEEWEYDDALSTRAYELADMDENSLYARIKDAIENIGGANDTYVNEYDIDQVMAAIADDIAEDNLNVADLDNAIREYMPETDLDGEPASGGAMSARVLQELGYKGVIDKTVNRKFGSQRNYGQGMPGLEPGSEHIITFPGNEDRIRSTYAKFDPRNASSKDITASLAPFAVALAAAGGSEDAEAGPAAVVARALATPENLVRLGYIQPGAINDPARISAGQKRYIRQAETTPAFLKREIMNSENPLIIKQRDMPAGKIITPEDLHGTTGVPVVGDRSTTGIDVDGVRAEGGSRYPQEHQGTGDAWASMRDAANKKQRNFVLAGDETGQNVTGIYTQMGENAINFSTPPSEWLLQETLKGPTTKKLRKGMDRQIRNPPKAGQKLWPGVGNKPDHPDKAKRGWVGIDHPDAMDQIMGRNGYPNIGNRRTLFAQTIGSKTAEALGFPVYNDIARATTESALGMDPNTTGMAGFQTFQAMPGSPTHSVSKHQTYDTAIPGEYLGGLEQQLPPEVMFPQMWADLSSAKNKKGEPMTRSQKTGSFMMNPKMYEVFDDRWLEGVKRYQATGEIPSGYKGDFANIENRTAAYQKIPNNQVGNADPRLLAGLGGLGAVAAGALAPEEAEAGRLTRAAQQGYTKPVYHGTLAPDVDEIDMNRVDLGMHLGTSEQASKRVDTVQRNREERMENMSDDDYFDYDERNPDNSPNILPLRMREGKVLEMADVGRWDNSKHVLDELANYPSDPDLQSWAADMRKEARAIEREYDFEAPEDWINSPENREFLDEINAKMRELGYDTVKYRNQVENAHGSSAGFRPGAWEADQAAAKEKNAIYDAAMAREPDPRRDALDELMKDPDVTTEQINEVMNGDWPARGPKYTPEEGARINELERIRIDIADQRREDSYSHIALDPANVRSEYAQFAPENEGKAKLMGGLGSLAVAGAAATGSEDAEAGIGKPLYHATDAAFDQFQTPAMFTDRKQYAQDMNRDRIVTAELDLENPADLRAMNISPSDPRFNEIAKDLQAQGYDGAQYRDEAYIAFEPEQIRQYSPLPGADEQPAPAPSPRLDRANAQEFNTDTTLYHGTDNDIQEFETGRAGLIYGSEDADYANDYAMDRTGANVMPLFMKPGRQFDMVENAEHKQRAIDLFNERGGWQNNAEMQGYDNPVEYWKDMQGSDYDGSTDYLYRPGRDMDWELLDDPETDILAELMWGEDAFDSFRFEERPGIVAQAVADPERVRSVNAQFKDPESGNVLASAVPAAVGTAAVAGALAPGEAEAGVVNQAAPFNPLDQLDQGPIQVGQPQRTPETERADQYNNDLQRLRAERLQAYRDAPRTFAGDMTGIAKTGELLARSLGGMALGGARAIWDIAGGAEVQEAIAGIDELTGWALEGMELTPEQQIDVQSVMDATGEHARMILGDDAVDLYNTGFERMGDAAYETLNERGYKKLAPVVGAGIRGLEMLSPI